MDFILFALHTGSNTCLTTWSEINQNIQNTFLLIIYYFQRARTYSPILKMLLYYHLNFLPSLQVSVGCQTINVYDLRYSKNPFECPVMLIGLCIGIGVLALIAIAAICCYACGKYRTQKSQGSQHAEHHQESQSSQVGEHYPNRRKRPFSGRMLSLFRTTPRQYHEDSTYRQVNALFVTHSLKTRNPK